MSVVKYQLRTVEVSGAPRELGRGQGEAFREEIQRFVEMRIAAVQRYFADRGQASKWDEVLTVGDDSIRMLEAWDPAGHAEHCGVAEGAGVDPRRLFTINNMTDMRDVVLLRAASGPPLAGPSEGGKSSPVDQGCTSVLVPKTHTTSGAALAGQTWDLNPTDLEYVIAVRRRPQDGPSTWAVTCTGCLTLMGINELGLAVGTTNIKTYGSRPGVGYLAILHRAIATSNARAAREVVARAPHAGAHTYWLADPDEQLEVEASPTAQFDRSTASGPLGRTNHCLFDAHRAIQGELPGDSSRARLGRVAELLASPQSVDSLKTLFADRTDGVLSINRFPEDAQGTATNAVFIAEPSRRRAWACRGPADRGRWVELSF